MATEGYISIENGERVERSPSQVKADLGLDDLADIDAYRDAYLAFEILRIDSMSVQEFLEGFVDAYEDESGIDNAASSNQVYDSTDDYYTNKDLLFENEKMLEVTSVTGTPTVSRAMPIKITSGDDSTTGTGEIVLDWSSISSKSDIGVYDENDNLLDYHIESFDATAETATIWVYRSWVRDGSTQAQVKYGNGPSDQSVAASTVFDNETDLQAGYLFNEITDTVPDITSNINDATAYSLVEGEDGIVGSCRRWNSKDYDYIDCPDLFNQSEWTFSIWFKTNEGTRNEHIFRDDGSQFSLLLRMNSSGEIETYIKNTSDTQYNISTTGSYNDDVWHKVEVCVEQNGTVEMRIDGVQIGSKGVADTPFYNGSQDKIGSQHDGTYGWFGKLDNPRFYSKFLSLSDREAQHDSEKLSPEFFDQHAATAGTTTTIKALTLISETVSVESPPSKVRLICQIKPIDTITLNSDLTGYVSADGGTTWDQVTLEKVSDYGTNQLLAGSSTLSSSGTDLEYKIESTEKEIQIHATANLGN